MRADLASVAAAIGSQLPDRCDGAVVATGVAIDSRTTQPGDLFVALPGTRTDGRRFLAAAAERGAVAAIAPHGPDAATAPLPLLVVAAPGNALTALAHWWRGELSARVVGISGSVGKTTTRRLVAAALGGPSGSVVQSHGNFNNAIGLPLTILAADRTTRFLVAELGTGAPGELVPLAELLRPDRSILTAAGPSHLDAFGTVDAVAREKATLAAATHESTLVLRDLWPALLPPMPRVRTLAEDDASIAARIVAGPKPAWPDGQFDPDAGQIAVAVDGDRVVGGFGSHTAPLLAAAYLVAVDEGEPVEAVCERLRACRPVAGRGTVRPVAIDAGTAAAIDDSYNANPMSVAAAARTLAAISDGRGHLVLGPMLGLGEQSGRLHEQTGRAIASLPLARLHTIGDDAARLAKSAGHPHTSYDNAEAAAAALRATLPDRSTFLVKGSRATRMERVLDQFEDAD